MVFCLMEGLAQGEEVGRLLYIFSEIFGLIMNGIKSSLVCFGHDSGTSASLS
jgi:hypothetical protein